MMSSFQILAYVCGSIFFVLFILSIVLLFNLVTKKIEGNRSIVVLFSASLCLLIIARALLLCLRSDVVSQEIYHKLFSSWNILVDCLLLFTSLLATLLVWERRLFLSRAIIEPNPKSTSAVLIFGLCLCAAFSVIVLVSIYLDQTVKEALHDLIACSILTATQLGLVITAIVLIKKSASPSVANKKSIAHAFLLVVALLLITFRFSLVTSGKAKIYKVWHNSEKVMSLVPRRHEEELSLLFNILQLVVGEILPIGLELILLLPTFLKSTEMVGYGAL